MRVGLRVLGVTLVVGSVALGVLGFAWTRDPRPRFAERHGALAAVERVAPEAVGDGGETIEHVRLVSTSSLAVDIAVRKPSGATNERRPLVVLLGGHETGRDAVRLLEATRGAIVAALSYPFDGPKKLKGVRVLWHVPKVRDALLDTPPAIELALDWLLQQPDVDPARTELVGVSLGSIFACIAGARDSRWTRVWVLHGAGTPLRLIEAGLERKGYWSPIKWSVSRAAYVAACGPHIAPENWIGSIAPRPVVLVNAADDERMPREAVLALHSAAREPMEVVWLPGQHVEPKRKEVVRALVDLVLDRVVGEAPR